MLNGAGHAGNAGVAPRIANGNPVFGYPASVALLRASDEAVFCSGVLIGCETVLTAAHCVCETIGAHCQAGGSDVQPANDILVASQNAPLTSVASVHVPAGYQGAGIADDIAVLKLSAPLSGITPMTLNDSVSVPFGTPGRIVGYGFSDETLSDNGIQRSGAVQTAACGGSIADSGFLCWTFPGTAAGGAPGSAANSCPGDSGGPLLIDFGSGPRVAGVSSGGLAACQEQGLSFAADVTASYAYIQAIAGSDLGAESCGPLAQAGDSATRIIPQSGQLGAGADEALLSFVVPEGIELLRVVLHGTQQNGNNFDLQVRFASAPTASEFDCQSSRPGTFEACEISHPPAGIWHAKATRSDGGGTYHLIATLFGDGDNPVNNLPALSNISYNGLVTGAGIRPAFIMLAGAQVVLTAESLGLADPQLNLKQLSGETVASNDNCAVADIELLIGRPLSNPLQDACIVQTLAPGAYFFEVSGSNNGDGNALAGVTQPLGAGAALQNISYNGFVPATGVKPAFNVAAAGKFAITAESLGLADPQIALKRLSGEGVAYNNDCLDNTIAALIGRPLSTALDACIVIDNLSPGAYFIEVSDLGGGSGNALIGATQIIEP